MKKTLTLAALVAAFGLAFTFSAAHTAKAAPADGTVTITAADLDSLYLGADPLHHGPGLGRLFACLQAAKSIHDACPCEGVDQNGDGTIDPWGTHGNFMECVNHAAEQLAAGENPPPAECLTKIVQGLDNMAQGDLKIGDEGFVCHPQCPGHGGPRGPRGPGGEN
jgi:hypothetical protein